MKYCAIPILATQVAHDLYLLQDPLLNRLALISPDQMAVLQQCREGALLDQATLEGHCAPPSAGAVGWVWDEHVLNHAHLVNDGWLLSHGDLMDAFRANGFAGGITGTTVSTVAIVTKNRPTCLQRALRAILRNRASFGRQYGLLVADDSDNAFAIDTESVCARVSKEFGVPVAYLGPTQKRMLIDALIRNGVAAPQLVQFALAPQIDVSTYGANLNAIMLATAGQCVLCCDDDMVPDTVAAVGTEDDLEIMPVGDPTEFEFFPSRDELLPRVPWQKADFVRPHETLLGANLADLVVRFGPARTEVRALDVRLRRSLHTGSGRIRVSVSGVAGDSGVWSPHEYLLLEGRSRDRLLANGTSYLSACQSREVVRVAPRTTITGGGFFMNACSGIDNRSLLPPFVPVCRGFDTTFAHTVLWCHEDAYFAFLPHAMLHAPPEDRSYTQGSTRTDATRMRVNDLVLVMMRGAPLYQGVGDLASRMFVLGAHLRATTSNCEEMFLESARWGAMGQLHLRAQALAQTAMFTLAAPAEWLADLKGQLAEVTRALEGKSDVTTPVDLISSKRNPLDAARLARTIIRDFGDLLCQWPAIVDAARALGAADLATSVPA